MQSFYAIIALIHVFSVVNIRRGPKNGLTPESLFSVVNIRRGPKNGLTPECDSGVKPFFGPLRMLTTEKRELTLYYGKISPFEPH